MAVETDSGWFLAGMTTVIASLASAVAFLFKLTESKNSDAITKLEKQVELQEIRLQESDRKHDECQMDRIKLTAEIAFVREQLSAYIVDHKGDQHGKA